MPFLKLQTSYQENAPADPRWPHGGFRFAFAPPVLQTPAVSFEFESAVPSGCPLRKVLPQKLGPCTHQGTHVTPFSVEKGINWTSSFSCYAQSPGFNSLPLPVHADCDLNNVGHYKEQVQIYFVVIELSVRLALFLPIYQLFFISL